MNVRFESRFEKDLKLVKNRNKAIAQSPPSQKLQQNQSSDFTREMTAFPPLTKLSRMGM